MTKKKYSKFDDVSEVTGVRPSDKLLLVDCDEMAFMKKYVKEVTSVSFKDVTDDFIRQNHFDRIFVGGVRRHIPTFVVSKFTRMNLGTITFFIEDDCIREVASDMIEAHWYPQAETWELTSNVGKCLITNARGVNYA